MGNNTCEWLLINLLLDGVNQCIWSKSNLLIEKYVHACNVCVFVYTVAVNSPLIAHIFFFLFLIRTYFYCFVFRLLFCNYFFCDPCACACILYVAIEQWPISWIIGIINNTNRWLCKCYTVRVFANNVGEFFNCGQSKQWHRWYGFIAWYQLPVSIS